MSTYSRMFPNGLKPSEYTIPLSSAPDNWKSLAPFPPTSLQPQTYAHQDALPHLPVPPLAQTLEKLKKSLHAMKISEEEMNEVERKIEAFGAPGGVGEVLQRRLEEKRETEERQGGRGHWLEAWWDDLAYMGYRDSVRPLKTLKQPY